MRENKIEFRNAFINATRKTFSEMAFIDVVESPQLSNEIKYSHIIYQAFIEPDRGDCALFLPFACKKKIVENIYGEDWENLNPDQTDDCLLELCNVLAGNYLIDVYGENARRDMSLPQLLFDEKHLIKDDNVQEFFFSAENVPFKSLLRHPT